MALIGDDCYFFYNQTCNKGPGCKFRHVEEAKGTEIVCQDWSLGRCSKLSCHYRHNEPPKTRQAVPCFYESQPGGCTRVGCQFAHQFPKTGPPGGAPVFGLQPQVTVPPNVRPGWAPPIHHAPPPGAPPTSIHAWIPPQGPPVARPRFMPPPGQGLPFNQFPPAQQDAMYMMDQTGDKMMPMIEPVIISLNSEESDQESMKGGSPQKPLSRTIVPPAQVRSDNPLDYFLNAKPWIDPRRRRTPSPKRSSPIRSRSRSPVRSRSRSPVRSRSRSPVRIRSRSPGRSPSPPRSISPVGRRRSVSVDRQFRRQRSHSLDRSRSQSPDARDRRRFVRRSSRSPPRHRSRSPGPYRGRPAHQDLRSKLKPQAPKEPMLAEVKVTGSKIISIKKDKKEEEEEKTEEQTEKPKEETDAKGFVQDEIKSLEEIYRERALKSLMDAKRKRIMEQKKKRWETVGEKKSESESSTKSDTEKPTEEAENTQDEQTAEEQSESEDSEADLADDVDVEIDVGDVEEEKQEEDSDAGKSHEDSHEDSGSDEERNGKAEDKHVRDRKAKTSVAKVKPANKPSIKSRLGLKAVEQVKKQASKDRIGAKSSRARSIKERLGLKASDDSAPVSQRVRSGVIRLSKSSNDLSSKIRDVRDLRDRKSGRSRDKKLMLLPHITIRNNVEERRAGIKQRLGLLDDRKRNDMDDELLKLLQEDQSDIEEEDIQLLTKKEKKRLLKKLLTEHGREDEYDVLKKRKKKGRRRERDEEIDRGRRRINVHSRLGPSPVPETRDSEEEAEDQLDSGEEIELAEEDHESENEETQETKEEEAGPESSNTKENVPSSDNDPELETLSEEKLREKAEKLKEALHPKTIADIRKERAEKKSRGELDNVRVTSGKGRRILLADDLEDTSPPKNEPPVKVTFGDEDTAIHRRLGQRTNIWSSRDRQEKSAKRERQIYIPPTMKRSDGPVTVTQKAPLSLKRAAEPTTGRDIVDYGDMFSKKSTPIETTIEPRAKTIKLTRSAEQVPETRPPARIQRGPPKVEIKDATVKTFAEIMAEKKRKRQLAQQENNPNRKPFTPITFDESDTPSQDSATSTVQEKSTSNLRSRLSPFEDASSNDSTSPSFKSESVSSSPSKFKSIASSVTVSVPKKSASEETLPGKPTRWKRRKTNPDIAPKSLPLKDNTSVKKTQEKISPVSTDNTSVQKTLPCVETKTVEKVVTEKVVAEKVVQRKPSEEVPPPAASLKSKEESNPVTERQTSLSDSFLDLDDDFLNMDDDDLDLDLAANQDHDTLMKEIDELLA